jgi:hypothetical protein
MHNYTPLVISGNDKKVANVNSHKPREIHFLLYKIIGAPKELKKWPHTLFRSKTNHTWHQKPNPSCETVPLSTGYELIIQSGGKFASFEKRVTCPWNYVFVDKT